MAVWIYLVTGIRRNSPQSPYITDGMPARTSVELLKKLETTPSLKYSPKKMEMAIENGMEMTRAIVDVINVPYKKGRAPNFSSEGSQSLLIKKASPKVLIEGIEAIVSVKKIARRSAIIDSPDASNILINRFSDLSLFVITVS